MLKIAERAAGSRIAYIAQLERLRAAALEEHGLGATHYDVENCSICAALDLEAGNGA